MTQDEIDLLSRAAQGDRYAYGQLVHSYQGLVFAVALNITGNWTDSEDIVQETFLRAWIGLRKLADPWRFSAWLCTIARRTAYEILKRNQKITIIDIDSELIRQLPSEAESPAEAYARQQMSKILWDEVAELPVRSREAILLFYIEGYSISRAAEFLGIAEGAFKMRLQYGRERLRDTLAQRLDEELRRRKPGEKQSALVLAALPSLPALTSGPLAPAGAAAVKWGGLALWNTAWAGKQVLIMTIVVLFGALAVVPVIKSRHKASDRSVLMPVVAPVTPAASLSYNLQPVPVRRPLPSRAVLPVASVATKPGVPMPAALPPSSSNPASVADASTTETVQVKVVDEAGRPVAGAVIAPYGLAFENSPTFWLGYPWPSFDLPTTTTSDIDGIATVVYPKRVMQKNIWAFPKNVWAILFNVDHPDYCPERVVPYPVKGRTSPVVLRKGATLAISGHLGSKDQRTPNLYPQINIIGDRHSPDFKGTKANDVGVASLHLMQDKSWQKLADGTMVNHRIPPGDHLLRLVSVPEQGGAWFSDIVQVHAEAGKSTSLELQLKPGIRVRGKLDSSVPRPIQNGIVVARVTTSNEKIRPEYVWWQTWRSIQADGSFVFESLPHGQLNLCAWSDGEVSKLQMAPLNPHEILHQTTFHQYDLLPETFASQCSVKLADLPMELASACEVTVLDDHDQPISQASVWFPSFTFRTPVIAVMDWIAWYWMPFGRLPGGGGATRRGWEIPNYEGTPLSCHSITDARGVALMRNLDPHSSILSCGAYHSNYSMAWDHYPDKIGLQPGQTSKVVIRLEKRLGHPE